MELLCYNLNVAALVVSPSSVAIFVCGIVQRKLYCLCLAATWLYSSIEIVLCVFGCGGPV